MYFPRFRSVVRHAKRVSRYAGVTLLLALILASSLPVNTFLVQKRDAWSEESFLGTPVTEAAMSGFTRFYLKKEVSDLNATYNSLSITGVGPQNQTASAAPSGNGTAVGTALCEDANNTGETFNKIGSSVGTLQLGADNCIASFISPPVGQAITIATGDTTALAGQVYGNSGLATGGTVNFHLFKLVGASTLTKFGLLTGTLPNAANSLVTFAATAPDTTVSLAAGDRIVLIASASTTLTAVNYIQFDQDDYPSYINLKYTIITPSKPALTGTRDDDFVVDASVTCSSGGSVYNTKWTCLGPSAANVVGGLNSEDTNSGTVLGYATGWLHMGNTRNASAGAVSNFGATPSNTFVYQALNPNGYGSGVVSTAISSPMIFTSNGVNAAAPWNHGGLVLWTSNTDYLEIQVYATAAKTAANTTFVALNTNGTLSGATSLNPATTTGVFGRVWVRFSYTSTGPTTGNYQAQYSTNGTAWNNVGSPVAHSLFTRVGLNTLNTINTSRMGVSFEFFQHTFTPPRLTVGNTGVQVVSSVNSGTIDFTPHVASCGAGACALTYAALDVGSGVTISSFTITEAGTIDAVNDLSNISLYYKYNNGTGDVPGANFENTNQVGTTVANFSSGDEATFTENIPITPAQGIYLFFKVDLRNGSNNPAGGQTLSFRIVANTDVTFVEEAEATGAPTASGGSTTIVPHVTSVTTYPHGGDGARVTQTLGLAGFGFGTTCNVAGGSKVSIGTYDLSCTGATFTKTTISIPVDTGINVYGGTGSNGLLVTIGNTADDARFTFYIYPTINVVTTPSIADAAREAESITLSNTTGNAAKFGGTQGTITFNGGFGSVAGTVTAWTDTSITVTVPTGISNSIYTGDILLTRNSDSKTTQAYHANGFRILPRITSLSPVQGIPGETVIQVNGDHFCQTGTCPVSPNRSSGTNNVKFDTVQATDAEFLNQTGAGTCAGSGVAWNHAEMCVRTPNALPAVNTPTSRPVLVTSNSYPSLTQAFTQLALLPEDPTNLQQYRNNTLTTTLALNEITNNAAVYFAANNMEVVGVSGGNLYLQVEALPVGTAFTCGGGDCAHSGVFESPAKAGPGPYDCRTAGNTCFVTAIPADGSYHWRLRVRHNRNSINYYSAWVSFGGNAESATDFRFDITPPVITNIVADLPTTNSAVITWDTLGEPSSTRIQYNKTGAFSGTCDSSCTPLVDVAPPGAYNHSVTLLNIDSGTTYYYRVRSQDEATNERISSTLSFSTGAVTKPAKTTKYHITSLTSTLAASSSTAPTFLVSLPEAGVAIKSAHVRLRGILTTTTGTPTIALQVNAETQRTYTLPTSTNNGFTILHPVTALNVDPTTNTLTINTGTNTSVGALSADIIITYEHNI